MRIARQAGYLAASTGALRLRQVLCERPVAASLRGLSRAAAGARRCGVAGTKGKPWVVRHKSTARRHRPERQRLRNVVINGPGRGPGAALVARCLIFYQVGYFHYEGIDDLHRVRA